MPQDPVASITSLLHQVPSNLPTESGDRFGLLCALFRCAPQVARSLVLTSALVHDDADERRTAEYLLRHRESVTTGRRSAQSLLSAARCAAEMDCRRVRRIEVPSVNTGIRSREEGVARSDEPAVAEFVLTYLEQVADHVAIAPGLREHILTAVTIAVELSRRHGLNNGRKPSVIAMRSDARHESRLVTHLRGEFGRTPVAAALARILVGPDGSPIETSLLWWAAQGTASAPFVPRPLRRRWTRIIAGLGQVGDRMPTLSTADHLGAQEVFRAS